jgi:hypothetical protein
VQRSGAKDIAESGKKLLKKKGSWKMEEGSLLSLKNKLTK